MSKEINHGGEHIIIGCFDGQMSYGLVLRCFWNGRFHENDLIHRCVGPFSKWLQQMKRTEWGEN